MISVNLIIATWKESAGLAGNQSQICWLEGSNANLYTIKGQRKPHALEENFKRRWHNIQIRRDMKLSRQISVKVIYVRVDDHKEFKLQETYELWSFNRIFSCIIYVQIQLSMFTLSYSFTLITRICTNFLIRGHNSRFQQATVLKPLSQNSQYKISTCIPLICS